MNPDPFATSNKLGLPLVQPSTQTILPVLCAGVIDPNTNELVQGSVGAASIVGWLPIASTTFVGTERTFTTSDGPIGITTMTLPPLASDGTAGTHRVQQYMAAVFPEKDERLRPWIGYSDFVDTRDSQYAMQWFMPTQGQGYRLNQGPIVLDLRVAMDADDGAPPTPPDPPDTTAGTLRWVTSVQMNDLQVGCPFIDFNWVELFKAQTEGKDPLRIEIVSNPVSGEFKSTIVPYPVVAPLGGVEFNTVRIIKLHPAAAGAYVFNYKVVDTAGQATPVVLTLTVV